MPTWWEIKVGLDPQRANAKGSPDHDGLSNLVEYRHRTKPRAEDSDRDGIDDGDEVKRLDSDPLDGNENDNGRRDGDDDADRDGTTTRSRTRTRTTRTTTGAPSTTRTTRTTTRTTTRVTTAQTRTTESKPTRAEGLRGIEV